MTVQISPSYLIENGYLENVQIADWEDGTPFAIFEDWDDVYGLIYGVIEGIAPEAISLYEEKGLIKKPRWNGNPSMLEKLEIDGKIPDIVVDALAEHEIREWSLVEDALGCEWGFSDEYTTCSDCYEVIRTSPDSYSWQPDYHVGDGYIVCEKCFNNNEDYQEEYVQNIINNYQSANQLLTDEQIEALGFKQVSNHEYMMFESVTNTPERLYHALKDEYEEVLFSIDSVGQFNTNYSVWVRGEK